LLNVATLLQLEPETDPAVPYHPTQPRSNVVTITLSFVAYTEINTNFGPSEIQRKLPQVPPLPPADIYASMMYNPMAYNHWSQLQYSPSHAAFLESLNHHHSNFISYPYVNARGVHPEVLLRRGRDSTSPKKESTRSPEVGRRTFYICMLLCRSRKASACNIYHLCRVSNRD
jgi:hypothetical protein